uniref:Uncharacterized protein n=1 Tax=Chloropicon primus TaxID=1764295 RepID=A0A7S2T2V4_9CHLO|mmetsp:Transcript_4943/g.14799  ORF Transcript_4943/g.14799 Transcript_4943/m.14799 type:complete len:131 (+) Transcript_4943:226-618(+)
MSVMQQLLARGAKQSWSGLSQTLCGRGATPATVASGLQSRTFAAAPSPKKAETEAYVRPSSDKEVPRDIAGILDASAQTLFITELMRGMSLALKYFFTKKVTVSGASRFRSLPLSVCLSLSLSLAREPQG